MLLALRRVSSAVSCGTAPSIIILTPRCTVTPMFDPPPHAPRACRIPGTALRPGLLAAVAAGLCLAVAPRAGADAGSASESGYALNAVQVTGLRRQETVHEVSAAVTVLDGSQVREALPQTLPEALRARTGTWFQQATPGQGTVIVRGLRGSQALHLVDGMRLNNAFFRSAPNQYLALVDPYNVAALQVVRGPASTIYGGDAMGGAVQVLTPEPVPDTGSGITAAETQVVAGTADQARIGRVSVTGGGERIAASTGLTYQEYGDRKTGSGDRIAPSDYRSRASDGKVVAELGAGADLMVSAQYVEQPRTPRTDELVAGFGQTGPASAEFYFEPDKRRFYHARLRFAEPVRGIDLVTVHAGQQVITHDRRTRDTGSAERSLEDNESDLRGLTVQADVTPAPGAQLSVGAEIYTDEITSRRRRKDVATGAVRPVASRFPDGSTLDNAAAYVLADAWVGDRLRLFGGLRYSRFDIDLAATDTTPPASLEPDDVTGHAQLWYALTPALAVVANAGRCFPPPNVFDLGTFGPRPGNRFNEANEDLDPESGGSVDLGVKLDGRRWHAEAFAFYSRYDDRIESVPT
jgi:outer membrane receptor protein involved in Fe transport